MKPQKEYDVAIIGAGLAGQVAACLLAPAGRRIAIIEPSPPASSVRTPPNRHIRTMAISHGSQKILEQAGVWRHVKPYACPIKTIDVRDGSFPFILRLLEKDAGNEVMGWIITTDDLRNAGFAALKRFPGIEVIKASARDFIVADNARTARVVLDNDSTIDARLIIGADGRASRTRDFIDPPLHRRDYKQRAIVCVVAHEKPHYNRATEFFWPEGPLAVLPMNSWGGHKHCSAVVLCEHARTRASFMNASEASLTAAIAARFPQEYGAIQMIAPPAAYPLTRVHAAHYIAPRMALIADAAHGIHPIAGQGLNLGLQDTLALARALDTPEGRRDAGHPHCLQAYERERRPATIRMIVATEALNTLFSSNFAPFKIARRAGLRALAKSPVLRGVITRYAMGHDA